MNPTFKLGDIVKTVKGARFWGRIIAFDNDIASPGCTVMAIDPGFLGTKHVYPLKQLEPKATHYVLPRGLSSMVKEAELFISQGGLLGVWGDKWKPVYAESVEDARMLAAKMTPIPGWTND